jgi:hypothetical protein
VKQDEEMYTQLFHEWRVASARIVALRDQREADRYILNAVKEKVQFVTKQLDKVAGTQLDIEGLEEIFTSAVKLDAQIEQQRPKFVFSRLFSDLDEREDLTFNKSEMEAIDEYNNETSGGLRRQVRLVRRPGLWKLGNSAGKDYRKAICILPAIVDLEPLPHIR